jgi:hypothetical protein
MKKATLSILTLTLQPIYSANAFPSEELHRRGAGRLGGSNAIFQQQQQQQQIQFPPPLQRGATESTSSFNSRVIQNAATSLNSQLKKNSIGTCADDVAPNWLRAAFVSVYIKNGIALF